MSTIRVRTNVVSGLFKIIGEPVVSVAVYVNEWKEGIDGARFERIAVRDCTGKQDRDNNVAIEFTFILGSEDIDAKLTKRGHIEFFHKYTDLLRRRFGNGLVVWDLSTPVYEIVD